MNALHDHLSDLSDALRPDHLIGAILYLLVFIVVAIVLTRILRAAVHAAMTRGGHIDRTTISFAQQFGSALIWVVLLILYAHLIPVLRAMGTALLAGASVASVVIGLAAQSTLGNLIAGFAITLYKPFRLGDTLQAVAPTGTEIGVVEAISLGYTSLRTADGRLLVVPNSLVAGQATINLAQTYVPLQASIDIRVPRDADMVAARQLALAVAKEVLGEAAVDGCFLSQIEGDAAVLELRFHATAAAQREEQRSELIVGLAERFQSDPRMKSSAGAPPSFA
ncbi:MAG: mechanosensitive ion channel family protein [Proteobacteria bacterium]|nr:mechanosensitive ion channel family protein [Pseudomonadota bacterium]